jgi:hypothetical protein
LERRLPELHVAIAGPAIGKPLQILIWQLHPREIVRRGRVAQLLDRQGGGVEPLDVFEHAQKEPGRRSEMHDASHRDFPGLMRVEELRHRLTVRDGP